MSGLLLGAGFRIGSQYTVRAKYSAIGLDRFGRSGILFLGKGYCSYILWRGTPMAGFAKKVSHSPWDPLRGVHRGRRDWTSIIRKPYKHKLGNKECQKETHKYEY